MRTITLLIILCMARIAAADQLTYLCKTSDKKDASITFDKSIALGATPETASVFFSIPNEAIIQWTTPMFMGLNIKSLNKVYVEFRNFGPWNLVSLEIENDFKTATANIDIKDSDIHYNDLVCKLK